MGETTTCGWAANWYLTRRHWSTDLTDLPTDGRRGHAICNANTEVWDQHAHDRLHPRYGGRRRVAVDDLPACKGCVKALRRQEIN